MPTASPKARRPLISVATPVYFEEDVLPEFYARTKAVLESLAPRYDHELIFVNDGSTDRSLPIMLELAERDARVVVIDLSRNFGHQKAITAGIDHARGDAVVIMDADLQDTPETIVPMIAQWEAGNKVVYATRERREGESAFKLWTAEVFYRLIQLMSDTKLPRNTGDFRLMDRCVVDVLKDIREESRYLRGLTAWVGFRQAQVMYKRDARYAGETKFTLGKMFKFAFDAITSFSERPLRLATQLGFVAVGMSFAMIIWLIVEKLISPNTSIAGWTSVMITVFFLGGTQLLSIGMLGEYIGRIYREAKARPLYIVGEIHGRANDGGDGGDPLDRASDPTR